MKNNFFVHVEDNKKSKPRPHEEIAARIIARHFQSNVVFLRRLESKSPDLFVLKTNVRWELKSPIGNGKHTIQNNLRDANKQSENVIVDLSRMKMSESQAISRIKEFISTEHTRVKRITIIKKNGQVVDILSK